MYIIYNIYQVIQVICQVMLMFLARLILFSSRIEYSNAKNHNISSMNNLVATNEKQGTTLTLLDVHHIA